MASIPGRVLIYGKRFSKQTRKLSPILVYFHFILDSASLMDLQMFLRMFPRLLPRRRVASPGKISLDSLENKCVTNVFSI